MTLLYACFSHTHRKHLQYPFFIWAKTFYSIYERIPKGWFSQAHSRFSSHSLSKPLVPSVGILELYLSVWQTSTASWNKAAPTTTVPISVNLSGVYEGEGYAQRGSFLGFQLENNLQIFKSCWTIKLNKSAWLCHLYTACLQCTHCCCQKIDSQLSALCTGCIITCFVPPVREDKLTCHMSQDSVL